MRSLWALTAGENVSLKRAFNGRIIRGPKIERTDRRRPPQATARTMTALAWPWGVTLIERQTRPGSAWEWLTASGH